METMLIDEAVRRLIWRERTVWLLRPDGTSAWTRNPVGALRSFDPLSGRGERSRVTRAVDRAVRSFRLERDLVGWRGLVSPWLRARMGSWLTDLEMLDPAYPSVTTRRDVVVEMLAGIPGAILLEVPVPKATHVLPLGAIARPPRVCDGELLLPRATRLRIGGVSRGPAPVVTAAVVSDE